ncbi:MAG TPA: ubiquitin, partial [Chryseobacterium sp.]|nr:ubiquitin [Chryseobacterium sp.]
LSVSGITKDQQYEIYSMDGKMIKTGTYSSGKTIDVNILTKGVYLLKIENQNLKFIKD